MPSPSTYPPAAQLKILAERLAKKAKVPTDNRDDFCEHISQTVLRVRKRDRRSTGRKPGLKLTEAADAARTLQRVFLGLSEEDRDWLENIKGCQIQFAAGEIQDLEATILNQAMLFNAAIGRPSPLPQFLKRGSPKIKDQMLRELVFGMLAAAAETGGKLTFNGNSETGTLAQALDLLRDYLPRGLLATPLPASSIKRLKSDFSRFRR